MPLGEASRLQFGYGYQDVEIKTVGLVVPIQNFVNLYGTHFQEIRLSSGWSRNTYDQFPYPTRGTKPADICSGCFTCDFQFLVLL